MKNRIFIQIYSLLFPDSISLEIDISFFLFIVSSESIFFIFIITYFD